MSEKAAKELKEIMNDPKFHGTWVLLQSLADIYQEFQIIDKAWLKEINERFEKQETKK